MTRTRLFLALAAAIVASAPAGAQQGRGRAGDDVPAAYRPPAGMCRIWLDDVPPAQQPAPTDCASAVRNRPSNGRVIFGDEPKEKSGKFDPRRLRGGSRDDVWDRRRASDDARADKRATDARDEGGRDDEPSGPLPAMAGGALFMRGIRTPDVTRWLGDATVSARVSAAGRDGTPARVTWTDSRSGQVVQVWIDEDGDGRADRVEFWREGRRVRAIGG